MHISSEFMTWLRREYPFIKVNMVPAGCTSKCQIADICLNRPFKVCMKKAFMKYATEDVLQQLRDGVEAKQITHDLTLSSLKPLLVDWIIQTHEHLKSMSSVVVEAYTRTGIAKAWDSNFQARLPSTCHYIT